MPHTPEPLPIGPEALLVHAEWVRALAARLVADPATAQDVEQEVWVRTLESPPRTAENLRGWLATIARNVASQLGRSERRRAGREEAAARSERTVDTAELVAEAEQQRQLVDEVLALEEPYRTAILLRYFRELPPAEIARILEIPRNTVRTRLARALEDLRSALDRRHENRASWMAAFAVLGRRSAPTQAVVEVSAGVGAALTAKLVAALAFLSLLGWVAWKFLPRSEETSPDRLASSSPASAQIAPVEVTVDSGDPDPGRILLSGGQGAVPPKEQARKETSTKGVVSGRLVDLAGKPVPGLAVEWMSFELMEVTAGLVKTQS